MQEGEFGTYCEVTKSECKWPKMGEKPRHGRCKGCDEAVTFTTNRANQVLAELGGGLTEPVKQRLNSKEGFVIFDRRGERKGEVVVDRGSIRDDFATNI